MRDERWQATLGNPKCGNPAPHPSALEQQPENQPQEGREEYGEVFSARVAHRVLVAARRPVCKRWVLVGLVHGSCSGGAKV